MNLFFFFTIKQVLVPIVFVPSVGVKIKHYLIVKKKEFIYVNIIAIKFSLI
jgi:hypothetical protein